MNKLSELTLVVGDSSITSLEKGDSVVFSPDKLTNVILGMEKRYELPSDDKYRLGVSLSPAFSQLLSPLKGILPTLTPMESGSNREITFTYNYQIKGLIYYHLEEHSSAKALLESMRRDQFVRQELVPKEGLGNSPFYEVNNNRGVTQTVELFDRLAKKVGRQLKSDHLQLGDLMAIDGSLIDATLSMVWADYTANKKKAKAHIGFDLNNRTPRKLILTDRVGNERIYLPQILQPGQTAVSDRGLQDHQLFDQLIDEGKHFVMRIKNNTKKEIIEELPFEEGPAIFFHAEVIIGDPCHRMKHSVILVGFRNHGKLYWVITDRTDLTAEQIAAIFALRWEIEQFFHWWKSYMKVYWLIARSKHGMLLQLLSGLITYILFLLYCSINFDEPPNIKRLRELRWIIHSEAVFSLVFLSLRYFLPDFLFQMIIQTVFLRS